MQIGRPSREKQSVNPRTGPLLEQSGSTGVSGTLCGLEIERSVDLGEGGEMERLTGQRRVAQMIRI